MCGRKEVTHVIGLLMSLLRPLQTYAVQTGHTFAEKRLRDKIQSCCEIYKIP